jgi:hypothetical protein
VLLLALVPGAALAQSESGVLVVAGSTAADDLRLGALSAGFARKGLESFVALDMSKPPPDADLDLEGARRLLDDARRSRRNQDGEAARRAGDRAIQILERCAYEPGHLTLLVEALVERGAAAIRLGDTAKAETVFLEAIALDPTIELDEELFDEDVRRLFGEVHRASRQLRYGSIRIEVPGLEGASVSVDFSAPRDPPYDAKLSDGRHFVSVGAPGRTEVVSFVPVRAGRQTDVAIRPPIAGDGAARTEALAAFRTNDPASIAALAAAAGLRFVLVADLGRSNVTVQVYDGRSGTPVDGATATLSSNPAPAEIDAAIAGILAKLESFDPSASAEAGEPWYQSWWAISILGVAIAGAAAATAAVLATRGETEYRFER